MNLIRIIMERGQVLSCLSLHESVKTGKINTISLLNPFCLPQLTVSCLLYFRRLGTCYSPKGKSLVWRRAERGVVDGWTWFWSDTLTWSMASLRKEPSHLFRILSLPADVNTQFRHELHHALDCPLSSELSRVTSSLAELPWRSWTFWTHWRRLKWAWPIRLMDNLYQVSQVGLSHLQVLEICSSLLESQRNIFKLLFVSDLHLPKPRETPFSDVKQQVLTHLRSWNQLTSKTILPE